MDVERRGPGRPHKFGRPSRAVTVTLPEDVIGRLSAIDVDLGRAIVAVVQRRRLHFEPRQHLMPDIGTLYECVLRGECNLPERDDQTDRTQRYRQQRTGFDRQLPNGWLAHWMKPEMDLSRFEPPKLDAPGADVRKVVLRLLHKPAFGTASEYLGQPHRHFSRNSALLVHEFGQRSARDAKGGSGIRDGQAQRLNALSQHKAAGVRWILHRHGSISLNSNRLR